MLRRWKSHVCFPYIFGISAAYEGCSESNTPILWCWWYGSRGWTFPCCCCVTDGSRGEVWQNGVWCGSADEEKVCHWIPPCGKNDTHCHSSTLAEHLWRPESGCEHSEVWGGYFWAVTTVTVGHLNWCRFVQVLHACSCSSLVKMHTWWWCLCWKMVFVADSLFYQIVLLCSLYLL